MYKIINGDDFKGFNTNPLIDFLIPAKYNWKVVPRTGEHSTVSNVLIDLDSFSVICYKYPELNYMVVSAIGVVSFIFHYHQCFACSSKREQITTEWWNGIDLTCASGYGVYIMLCFAKRSLLFMSPLLITLLVGGGIAKVNKHYHLYFLLHGLWHLGTAVIFAVVVCS